MIHNRNNLPHPVLSSDLFHYSKEDGFSAEISDLPISGFSSYVDIVNPKTNGMCQFTATDAEYDDEGDVLCVHYEGTYGFNKTCKLVIFND